MNNERLSFLAMLSNGYKWIMIASPFIVAYLMFFNDMTFSDIIGSMFTNISDGSLAFFLAVGDYILGPIFAYAKTLHIFLEMIVILATLAVVGFTLIFLFFAWLVIPVYAVFSPTMVDAWRQYDYGGEFVAPMIEGMDNDANMSHDNPIIRKQAENIDLANRINGKY